MGANQLLLLVVGRRHELIAHKDVHHLVAVLLIVVQGALALGSGLRCAGLLWNRHRHLLTAHVHSVLKASSLIAVLEVLRVWSGHWVTTHHRHRLLIWRHLVLKVIVEPSLVIRLMRSHSCSAILTTIIVVALRSANLAVATLVLELTHQQTQASNQLNHILIIRLKLTSFLPVERRAIPLLLLTFLTRFLGLTKVNLKLTTSDH